uniref:RING-type domain-containing protein n=1 Tax=Branchiostoma floridae TaxID=7739 RepID=C3YFB0_BRAFL|eukprot:XP_002604863.1 hypothetical protein BRAFLDRAFT_77302 [Branchiostoma floridae]
MADWVHCNLCFRQPGDGKKFHLTNCGHIYCADCVMTGAKDRCKMCGGKCTTIILSAHMKPDVEIFFTDPAELAKKQHKQLLQDAKFSTEMKKVKQQMTLHVQEMERNPLSLPWTTQVSIHHCNQQKSALHGNRTPTGPARITMRTPPIDGKMGPSPTQVLMVTQVRLVALSSVQGLLCPLAHPPAFLVNRSADSRIASTLSMFATPKRQLPYNSPSSQPNSAHQAELPAEVFTSYTKQLSHWIQTGNSCSEPATVIMTVWSNFRTTWRINYLKIGCVTCWFLANIGKFKQNISLLRHINKAIFV